MEPTRLRLLLERIQNGQVSVDDGMEALRNLPFASLGFATVDHHRHLRTGFPEVIFGQGKTVDQIVGILREIASAGENGLVTRVDAVKAAAICAQMPTVRHEASAGACVLEQYPPEMRGRGKILVISAGTSDIPVAEEAALTAHMMGNEVTRIFDVGVAGIHRVLARKQELESAEVLIVCAGMEGALASVVGGLVGKPVIAVPTSVGYGASFGGIAALLGMLNACASGVVVVNIDNGFGAGYAAALMNRQVANTGDATSGKQAPRP